MLKTWEFNYTTFGKESRFMARKRLHIVIAIFFSGFFALSSYGWPVEVAPELNFTSAALKQAFLDQENKNYGSNPLSFLVQERFNNLVIKKCPSCTSVVITDKYGVKAFRIYVDDDWYFEITLDPEVIEIKFKPISMDKLETKTFQDQIDQLIFNVASELGLEGARSNHLNFGTKSSGFEDNPLLFHNFLVEYWNNIFFVTGINYSQEDSKWDAPHPEELDQVQRDNLMQILEKFNPSKDSIYQLSQQIFDKVYYKSTYWGLDKGEFPEKFHAIGLQSLVREEEKSWPRAEIRNSLMPRNAFELYLQFRLFTTMIEFLKKSVHSKLKYDVPDWHYQLYKNSSETPVIAFANFLKKLGLNWWDYRFMIAPSWQRFYRIVIALDREIQNEQDKKEHAIKCETILLH